MKLDKPVLQQLYAYWDKKRAGRPYPARDDIDVLDLRFIIGSLLLVDIEFEPLRFRYRLFGTDVAQRQGFDMTGKYLEQHPWPELAAMARQAYIELMDSHQPALLQRQGLIGDQYVHHQSLVLPLGHDRVEMILIGVVFTPRSEHD